MANEAGAAGAPMSTVDACSWDFTLRPAIGWGDQDGVQKPTAGWLSALAVFEPHWQARVCVYGGEGTVGGGKERQPAGCARSAGWQPVCR